MGVAPALMTGTGELTVLGDVIDFVAGLAWADHGVHDGAKLVMGVRVAVGGLEVGFRFIVDKGGERFGGVVRDWPGCQGAPPIVAIVGGALSC